MKGDKKGTREKSAVHSSKSSFVGKHTSANNNKGKNNAAAAGQQPQQSSNKNKNKNKNNQNNNNKAQTPIASMNKKNDNPKNKNKSTNVNKNANKKQSRPVSDDDSNDHYDDDEGEDFYGYVDNEEFDDDMDDYDNNQQDSEEEVTITQTKKKAKKSSESEIKPKPVVKNKNNNTAPSTAVVSFDDDETNKKLSKAEKKAKRLEANKIWQSLHDRRHLDEDDDDQEQVREETREVKRKGTANINNAATSTSQSSTTIAPAFDLNPRHTQYYQIQLADIFSPTSSSNTHEWEQFVTSMKQELPMTFRISQSIHPRLRKQLVDKIEHSFKRLKGRFVQFKGEPIVGDFVKPVNWLPCTYQLAVDNHTLSHDPALVDIHQFITREVDLGHIVRQEVVSMIPAMLLDLHHSHIVLDCCAAPGSKTEQVYALMMQSARNEADVAMKGFLMANDSDPKRIQTLINRFQKCFIPNILFSCMNGESLSSYFTSNSQTKEIFDRIVCDVPCSGDGTFRKCPHLWRLFRPRIGIDFHKIQVNILKETLKVLKPGGKVVYSTCSLNPIEDEAVIAAVLRKYRGKVRLAHVDVSQVLPGLRYRPGISHWRADAEIFVVGEEASSGGTAGEGEREKSLQRLPKLVKSLLPPANAKEIEEMQLHRCLRILPHDQDTGGFFIALLEKIESIPFEEETSVVVNNKASNDASAKDSTSSSAAGTAKTTVSSSLQVVDNKKKKATTSGVTGKSLQAMTELGYNPKKASLSELVTFSVNPLVSLSHVTEFPTLKMFRTMPWKTDLLYLNDKEDDVGEKMEEKEVLERVTSKPYCFVQRVPTQMMEIEESEKEVDEEGLTEKEKQDETVEGDAKTKKNEKKRVLQVKDNNRIDPSELVIIASKAAEAVNTWATGVPILHLGANMTTNSNKVITKGFAFHPYAHNVLQDFMTMGQNVIQATISSKDMSEIMKLVMVKIQAADNNPFAKEIKKIVNIDYFEDRDGDKAAFMQHAGLDTASHIPLSDESLSNLSNALHQLEQFPNTKDRFFLCLTVDNTNTAGIVGSSTSADNAVPGNNNEGNNNNKRRLSKAEKKKLAKEKEQQPQGNSKNKTQDNKNQASTDDARASTDRLDLDVTSSSIETSPLTLLFVCSWTSNPEETTTDFASHWMLLTPTEVYESIQSILI